MKLVQLPAAEAEVDDAVAYYEQKRAGLGLQLLTEIRRAYDVVSATPNRWPNVGRGARRYRLDRFPYGVVYVYLPRHGAHRVGHAP
jgi:hypothetical protein